VLSAGFWNRDGGLYIKDFVLALFELSFATCVRKIKEIDIVQIYHFLILISSTQVRSFRRKQHGVAYVLFLPSMVIPPVCFVKRCTL
jgi:hypothetical protein